MAKKKVATSKKKASPAFEESLESIEEIVGRLESGELDLTESLKQYELGVKQLRHCHQILAEAEQKVTMLSGVDADGNPITERLPESQVRGGAQASEVDADAEGQSNKTVRRKASVDPPGSGDGVTDMDDSAGLF